MAATAATDGNRYIAPADRTGNESIVYFTRDLSAEGLRKAYAKVNGNICGKTGIKLHTGEPHGPNIIPRAWVRELLEKDLPEACIIETNTYYEGDRYTTEQHRKTIAINGWDFCPVDIMDEEGTALLPVAGGKWFENMSVGDHMLSYDSMVTLTHFKGHAMGGFGGSNKNIGIGCADGRIGKAWIHAKNGDDWGVVEEELMEKISESTKATIDHFGKKGIHAREGEGQWSVDQEELMEKISESTKATIDFFGKHVTYVNVMRNMSVSCDCEGVHAQPVVTPNVGILASTDIVAIDTACVDLVFAMNELGLVDNHDLLERMTSRHSMRQLSYMHELGMGNWNYILIDLDNDGKRISLADAVAHVVPFEG